MKEQTILKYRQAKQIEALLAPCPTPMSHNGLRMACEIGTRISLYLLQSSLVPCIHTGKSLCCHKIIKADVALRICSVAGLNRSTAPRPAGGTRIIPGISLIRTLNFKIVSRLFLRCYLEQRSADAPDMPTVEQSAGFSGYTSYHTVSCWCSEGCLHTIQCCPRFMMPKVWLLNFLTSEDDDSSE